MGARLSQTNIFALGSMVSATEWDIENILRRFEKRRFQYALIESYGKLMENVPHYANAAEPEFLIPDEETLEPSLGDAGSLSKPVTAGNLPNPSATVGDGGAGAAGDDASSSRLSLATSINSPSQAPSHQSISHLSQPSLLQLQQPFETGERLDSLSITGGQVVSPMPSLFEGDENMPGPWDARPDGDGDVYEEHTNGQGQGQGDHQQLDDNQSVGSRLTRLPSSYLISREALRELLLVQNVHHSDVRLLDEFFSLVDTRGSGEVDLRDVMMAFALVTAQSVAQFLEVLFRIADRPGSQAMERRQMHRCFTLVNECVFYVGDRPLEPKHVTDLVDSVFTTAGKVDGHVTYGDYLGLIEQHPILEMFCSTQFQGLARDKVWDPHTLETVDVDPNFDRT